MATILHASDLHFGPPAVLEQIAALHDDVARGGVDVVAISGDFSQRSLTGEFQCAAMFLTGVGKYSATITVPGNHDTAWWYAPFKIGNYQRIHARYRHFISDDLEPALHVPGVSIVGLNSSHGITLGTLTKRPRDLSIIGNLTPQQLDAAAEKFAQAPAQNVKIAMMHHNPVRGRLSQRFGVKHPHATLERFAAMGVDIVLCGHDHEEQIAPVQIGDRRIIVLTAGTMSNRSRGGRPSAYFAITTSDSTICVEPRIWSAQARAFVAGAQECFDR